MRRNQYARWSGPRVPHERRAELIRTSCTRRVRNPTHRDNLCRGRWLCPGTPVCPEGRCQLNASHHDPATKYRNTPKPPWQLGHWNTKAGARKTSDFRTPVTARSSSAYHRKPDNTPQFMIWATAGLAAAPRPFPSGGARPRPKHSGMI